MDNKQRIGLCIFFILISSLVVLSVQTQINIQEPTAAITIVYPKSICFPQATNVVMSFDVLNSNYSRLTNTSVDCRYWAVNSVGAGVANGNLFYNGTVDYWNFVLSKTNTANIGDYFFYVHCNSTAKEKGYISSSYEVSANGNCKEVTGQPLAVIILIPLLIGIFFLIISITLGDDHTGFKLVLLLGSFMPFFSAFHMATVVVVEYYHFEALQNVIGTTVYWFGLILAVIFFYFLIYIFYTAINMAAEDKKARLKY